MLTTDGDAERWLRAHARAAASPLYVEGWGEPASATEYLDHLLEGYASLRARGATVVRAAEESARAFGDPARVRASSLRAQVRFLALRIMRLPPVWTAVVAVDFLAAAVQTAMSPTPSTAVDVGAGSWMLMTSIANVAWYLAAVVILRTGWTMVRDVRMEGQRLALVGAGASLIVVGVARWAIRPSGVMAASLMKWATRNDGIAAWTSHWCDARYAANAALLLCGVSIAVGVVRAGKGQVAMVSSPRRA